MFRFLQPPLFFRKCGQSSGAYCVPRAPYLGFMEPEVRVQTPALAPVSHKTPERVLPL